ncbi:phage tail assembly protein [Bradyrhizobium yuanmingense]|uniref:phage tail assembly protein n=1 Tax=Bradyrhizobium yuanmingense TaxID=108015 RepID=UPI0004B1E390|nr:phage tail assembly protein [Bradyrhizobium yuanmingense]
MSKIPEYLKEEDGAIVITLAKPITADGTERKSLRMREPTVGDLENSQLVNGTDTAREIQLFANLMEIAADDVRGMSLRNYNRVQAAFGRFTD